MNIKVKSFIKNVMAMFLANGISFLISALITFIIPKILNVESYSYVQLYIFYTSYMSYLHYGWVDGIRLRYGGIYYEKINKKLFKSQIFLYSILQIIISLVVLFVLINLKFQGEKQTALLGVGLCMIIRLPRLMPQYILEMSNRIKECARITIIEKISYLIIVICIVCTKKTSVFTLVGADIIGQIFSCLYAFYCCKDILKSNCSSIKDGIKEAKENVIAGIKLTVANISSILIIGIVRQFIEIKWDVSTFGKLSLTMSISNLLMLFIRAIAMVMFPTLRRIDKSKLVDIYIKMRVGIMVPLLFLLVLYYPLKIIMENWLPQYQDSLRYMALLFPMCIFESKMSMLIETYLKTLRMEKWLLKVNVLTVLLSIVMTVITTVLLHNLNLAVLSIVLLLAFRSVFAEKVLSYKMKVNVNMNIILELTLVTVFILSSWFIGNYWGLLLYLIFYLVYLVIIKRDIKKLVLFLVKGLKNED